MTPTESELSLELAITQKQRDTEALRASIMQESLEEIASHTENYTTDPITIAHETLEAIGANRGYSTIEGVIKQNTNNPSK